MLNQLLAQIGNPVVSLPTGARGADALNHVIRTGITFALLAAAVIFLFMLIVGAISWITAGGDKGAIEDAKKRVVNALIGIVVVFSVYALSTAVGKFFGVDMLVFSNATPAPAATATPGGTPTCTTNGQTCIYGITECCNGGTCSNSGSGFVCIVPTPTPNTVNCSITGPTTINPGTTYTWTATAQSSTSSLSRIVIDFWDPVNNEGNTFASCNFVNQASGTCSRSFDPVLIPGVHNFSLICSAYETGGNSCGDTGCGPSGRLNVTIPGTPPTTQIRVNNLSSYVTTATPDTNVDVTLTWTSANATTCTASTSTTYPGSNWSGNVPGSGTRTSTIYADPATIGSTQTTSYTITCTGPGGTSTNTATATLDVH